MKQFKNILVVRTDRIGDVVLTTPAIRSLRNAYPNSRISLLVSKQTVDLVDDNPDIDEVFVDDKKGEHKGLFGYLKLVRELKQRQFDLAIVYHTKKRTNLLCFLVGISHRVGYKDKKFGFLLTDPIKDVRHLGQKHEAQYCLDVLEHLGIEVKLSEPFVPLKDEGEDWVKQLLQKHNIHEKVQLVAIHPGASDPSKCWSEKSFSEFMEKFNENKKVQYFIIGARELKDKAQRLVKATEASVIDLTGETSVSQMASLLSSCDLLVSNDSGPVHVAAAVGTPVVSIFTRNQPGINAERWKPLGGKSKIVSVNYDDSISFAKAGGVSQDFAAQIKTSQVLEAANEVLKTKHNEGCQR